MATITDKRLIDQLIRDDGKYESDPDVALIVEYTNASGGTAWGVTWVTETPERQARYLWETAYVIAPRLIYSRRGEDPRCRYEDCANGYRLAADDEQVTCPKCREALGLDPATLDDTESS